MAIDQRGTGAGALRCPALQREMGASDLTPPSRGRRAGVRRAASGPSGASSPPTDTVADLELLRQALGADRIALDGTSYGTYVAERYALAHPGPRRPARARLGRPAHRADDDVGGPDAGDRRASSGRAAARDLRTVVARDHDGPELLDTITANTIGTPRLGGIRRALAAAARGDTAPLDRIVAATAAAVHAFPAPALSQGLHASTLCADVAAPWGDAAGAARRPRRAAAAGRGARSTPARSTAPPRRGNGVAQQCLAWPPTPVRVPDLPADLPDVPTLLLAGTRDLSTPLEWARAERAHAPGGRLSSSPAPATRCSRRTGPQVERALGRFLSAPAP